eukprot:scaffold10510_cov15-Tisochrysis_lutea.AAC.2
MGGRKERVPYTNGKYRLRSTHFSPLSSSTASDWIEVMAGSCYEKHLLELYARYAALSGGKCEPGSLA